MAVHRVELATDCVEAILRGDACEIRVPRRPEGRARLRAGDTIWVAEPFLHWQAKRREGVEGISYGGVASHTRRPDHLRHLPCKMSVCAATAMRKAQSRLTLEVTGARLEGEQIVIAFKIARAA